MPSCATPTDTDGLQFFSAPKPVHAPDGSVMFYESLDGLYLARNREHRQARVEDESRETRALRKAYHFAGRTLRDKRNELYRASKLTALQRGRLAKEQRRRDREARRRASQSCMERHRRYGWDKRSWYDFRWDQRNMGHQVAMTLDEYLSVRALFHTRYGIATEYLKSTGAVDERAFMWIRPVDKARPMGRDNLRILACHDPNIEPIEVAVQRGELWHLHCGTTFPFPKSNAPTTSPSRASRSTPATEEVTHQ